MTIKNLVTLKIVYGSTLVASCATPLPELPSVLDAQQEILEYRLPGSDKAATVFHPQESQPQFYEDVDLSVLHSSK